MILVVCGPPGSGKTTIASRVHDRLRADGYDVAILHSDDYDRNTYEQLRTEVASTDAHCVVDGTFYETEHQERFLDLRDVHFVRVRADLDTCIRRDWERDGIGETAVRVVHSEFHEPPADFVVDTDVLPVEDAVRLVYDRAVEWLAG